mgnify:CR=1 FL=1
MKDITKYQGVIPAFYACYDAEGNISTEGVKALTRHLIAKGVKGVYVGGSSGECIYQHVDERKAVLEAVMSEAKGKLTVIAHVGCNNTADSVELARHAESVGVDAIASIPPIYFHLPEYAIAKYWNAMSAAAPHTDFVIYNIPQLAGVALTLPLLKKMLQNPNVGIGYANTIFYVVVGTVLSIFFSCLGAYTLSRPKLMFKKLFTLLVVFTMYFSGGLIPGYLNIRQLGLLNSRAVLLICGAVSTYNLIVARTFFANTIPWELHEAAFLDGCTDFGILRRIVLPLSSPIIVVLILYYGVTHWNSYFNALIYLTSREKYPLQVFLREILTLGQFVSDQLMNADNLSPDAMQELIKQADTANMIKYAVIIVSTVPMMVIYPWVQKYFAKGIMIGSVKG